MQQERWKQFVPKQLFPFGQWLISVFTGTRRRDRRGISCWIINFHGAAKICPTKRTNCTKPCNLFCGKSTALNGTVKKCRFNQFLSNVCTLHSQSCEVEKNIPLQKFWRIRFLFTNIKQHCLLSVFIEGHRWMLKLLKLFFRNVLCWKLKSSMPIGPEVSFQDL